MPVEHGSRHAVTMRLPQPTTWTCPACGVENISRVEDGCPECGAGRPEPACPVPPRRVSVPRPAVKVGPPPRPAPAPPPPEPVEPQHKWDGHISVDVIGEQEYRVTLTVEGLTPLTADGPSELACIGELLDRLAALRVTQHAVFYHADGSAFSPNEHEWLYLALVTAAAPNSDLNEEMKRALDPWIAALATFLEITD